MSDLHLGSFQWHTELGLDDNKRTAAVIPALEVWANELVVNHLALKQRDRTQIGACELPERISTSISEPRLLKQRRDGQRRGYLAVLREQAGSREPPNNTRRSRRSPMATEYPAGGNQPEPIVGF